MKLLSALLWYIIQVLLIGERAREVYDRFTNVDDWKRRLVQGQFARFDFGQIEQVIDQIQQHPPARQDVRAEALELGGKYSLPSIEISVPEYLP